MRRDRWMDWSRLSRLRRADGLPHAQPLLTSRPALPLREGRGVEQKRGSAAGPSPVLAGPHQRTAKRSIGGGDQGSGARTGSWGDPPSLVLTRAYRSGGKGRFPHFRRETSGPCLGGAAAELLRQTYYPLPPSCENSGAVFRRWSAIFTGAAVFAPC
jgi:hypothetical protein